MNTYLVPIADTEEFDTWIVKISAPSLEDCEDKLMEYLCDMYKNLPTSIHYTDFIEECDKQNICIGEIQDIEEL